MKHILRFHTNEQKWLFEFEIQGQISDGQWENAVPYDHYKVWGQCELEVGEQAGRTFFPRKDNYNLTNPDLLRIVGPRMLASVRIAQHYGPEAVNLIRTFLKDEDGSIDTSIITNTQHYAGEYWDQKREALKAYNLDELNAVLASDKTYSKKQMMYDLKEMKKIFKARIEPTTSLRIAGLRG